MCDSCKGKVNYITKKQCCQCRLNFCGRCVVQGVGSTRCKRCMVFSSAVMERRQLEELGEEDLRFYTTQHRIPTPIVAMAGELVELILGWQAKTLCERAQRALREVRGLEASVSVLEVDPRSLEPANSAYSSVGPPQRVAVESQASSTASQETGGRIEFDVSKVTHLEELQLESQLELLSVRQLKLILQRNCINYKGCVEKQELLERVVRLWRARQQEKAMESKLAEKGDETEESAFLCKVCMDAAVDCVFLNCGHMLTCVPCGRQLAECPVCRQYISRVVHAFRT